MDGQTKRVNQVLEDMLKTCVLDFQGKWEEYLPLVEFSYNNSYQSTIQMALLKHCMSGNVEHPYVGMSSMKH